MLNNRAYYDDFAAGYENHRGRGYHQLIDDLEVAAVAPYAQGARVLEVGCGTGLILERLADMAEVAAGVDLSAGMLAQAKARGLDVVHGTATALPFADASFDVACSFKVLAHIEDIRGAMAEMARVVRPGGHVLAEFYNPLSLRYAIKALKRPTKISETTDDEAVYTRYDSVADFRAYLPSSLSLETLRGVRIVTPVSHVHRIPGVATVFRRAETALSSVPGVRRLGGFVIAVCARD